MSQFVASLNAMPFPARMKALHTHPSPATILPELTKDEPTHESVNTWYLAVSLAGKVKDSKVVTRALLSRSAFLNERAAKVAHKSLSTDEIIEAVDNDNISINSQNIIYKSIISNNMRDVGTKLYFKIKDTKEGVNLLGLCDEKTTFDTLPSLPTDQIYWNPIVKNHANGLVSYLNDKLKEATNPSTFINTFDYPLSLLVDAKKTSEVMKIVLENSKDTGNVPSFVTNHCRFLTRKHPQEMTELFSNPKVNIRTATSIKKSFRRLSQEQQSTILKNFKNQFEWAVVFINRVPFQERKRIFQILTDDKPLTNEILSTALLSSLPSALRIQETKRMMELPKNKAEPASQENLAVYLGLEEGKEIILPIIRRSLADARREGWNKLVRLYGVNRADVSELLQLMVTRLKNEQEPVRQSAIVEFVGLPPPLFKEDLIPNLKALMNLVVDAHDVRDVNYLVPLCQKIIKRGVEVKSEALITCGFESLKDLVLKRGQISIYGFQIPAGYENRLIEIFAPEIENGFRTKNIGLLQSIYTAIGRKKAMHIERLTELLRTAIRITHSTWAVETYLKSSKDSVTKDARLKELVAEDESVLTVGNLQYMLTNVHTNLLDKYLDKNYIMKGNYIKGEPHHWIPSSKGAWKWTLAQQRAYIENAKHYMSCFEKNLADKSAVIRNIAIIPAASVNDLIEYTKEEKGRYVALSALKELDDKYPAIDIYLETLNSDDAKVSLFALGKITHYVTVKTANEILAKIIQKANKITVIKETIRLMIQLKLANAFESILAMLEKPNVHKDVKFTIIKSMVNFLDHEEAWKALEAAALSDENNGDTALAVCNYSYMISPIYHQRYGRLMLSLLKNPLVNVRNGAFGNLLNWAPILPNEIAESSSKFILDLSDINFSQTAVSVLLAATEAKASNFLYDTCKALVVHKITDEEFGNIANDLPSHKRLQLIVTSVESNATVSGQSCKLFPTIFQLLDLFKADPICWRHYASLRLVTLNWANTQETIAALRDLAAQAENNYTRTQIFIDKFSAILNNTNFKKEIKDIVEGLQVVPDLLALHAVLGLKRFERTWKDHSINMLKNIRMNGTESAKLLAYSTFIA